MRVLQKAIRREIRLQRLGGTGLVAGGMLLALSFFPSNTIVAVLGLLFGMTGIKLWVDSVREWNRGGSRLIRLLQQHPQRIVWVYSVVTERMPFGLQFSRSSLMYFKLLDGDEITVELPARQLKVVSKWLNRLLPHTTFGYSPERQQRYLANPASLLRDGKSPD